MLNTFSPLNLSDGNVPFPYPLIPEENLDMDQQDPFRLLDYLLVETVENPLAEESNEHLYDIILKGFQIYDDMSRDEMDAITNTAISATRELFSRDHLDTFALAYTMYIMPRENHEDLVEYIHLLRYEARIAHHLPYQALSDGYKKLWERPNSFRVDLLEGIYFLELAIASCDPDDPMYSGYLQEAEVYHEHVGKVLGELEQKPQVDPKIHQTAIACQLLHFNRKGLNMPLVYRGELLFARLGEAELQSELLFYALFSYVNNDPPRLNDCADLAYLLQTYHAFSATKGTPNGLNHGERALQEKNRLLVDTLWKHWHSLPITSCSPFYAEGEDLLGKQTDFLVQLSPLGFRQTLTLPPENIETLRKMTRRSVPLVKPEARHIMDLKHLLLSPDPITLQGIPFGPEGPGEWLALYHPHQDHVPTVFKWTLRDGRLQVEPPPDAIALAAQKDPRQIFLHFGKHTSAIATPFGDFFPVKELPPGCCPPPEKGGWEGWIPLFILGTVGAIFSRQQCTSPPSRSTQRAARRPRKRCFRQG